MTELGSNKSVQLQRLTKILHEASLLAVRKHQCQVFSRRGLFQYYTTIDYYASGPLILCPWAI